MAETPTPMTRRKFLQGAVTAVVASVVPKLDQGNQVEKQHYLLLDLLRRGETEEAEKLAKNVRQARTHLGGKTERLGRDDEWPWWSGEKPFCPDLNLDGRVDILDLARIAARYGKRDVNGKDINITSLVQITGHFDEKVNYRELRQYALEEGRFFEDKVYRGEKYVVYRGEVTLDPGIALFSKVGSQDLKPNNIKYACAVIPPTQQLKVLNPIIVHSGHPNELTTAGKALAFVCPKRLPGPFGLSSLRGLFVPLDGDTLLQIPEPDVSRLFEFLERHSDLYETPNFQITRNSVIGGERYIFGKSLEGGSEKTIATAVLARR